MTDVTVNRYPTRLLVKCAACNRQAQVAVFLDEVHRLRCRVCRSRDVVIIQRDRMRIWAGVRRGRK